MEPIGVHLLVRITCYCELHGPNLFCLLAFIDEKIYGVSSLDSYALILKSIESDWSRFVSRLKKLMKVSIFRLFREDSASDPQALALIVSNMYNQLGDTKR